MNNEMPWVNLTQEEVEELRNKKYELTEYGKQRLRELLEKQKKGEDINT
jgi:DNA-binding PadR family transcriptional regulator